MNHSLDAELDGRYRHTEYTVGSRTVTMIEDLFDEHAWIQSSVTYPVHS